MFFAKYIQMLHKNVECGTSRGAFAEKILKMIVTDESRICYSKSSYDGFYDGKTEGKGADKIVVGDGIKACARKIKDILDKDSNYKKYKTYLRNLHFNSEAKDALCECFRKEIPDINRDNYAEKLSQLLGQIIEEAADESSSTTPPPTGSRTNNEKSYTMIKEVVMELSDLFSKLDEIALKIYMTSKLKSTAENTQDEEDFKDLQEKFRSKNSELRLYRSGCPELKDAIDEIFLLSLGLTFFYSCTKAKDGGILFIKDKDVDKYQGCLETLMGILVSS